MHRRLVGKNKHDKRWNRQFFHKKDNTFTNNKVVNLSDKTLNYHHLSVLNKGLSFVPINFKCNKTILQSEIKNFERRLQLHNFFENIKMRKAKQQPKSITNTNTVESQNKMPFTKNPNFWPTPLNENINIFCHNLKVDLYEMTKQNHMDNLTHKERIALKDLRLDREVTIKKGDKGAGVVVMNTQDYLQKVDNQLTDVNTYLKVTVDDTLQVKRKADKLIHSLYNLKTITYKQRRYLRNFKPQIPTFLRNSQDT